MAVLKVLLVDDEEELVSTLAERLNLREFEARYVLNGYDAVKLVRENDFDVVVLDVMMPGLSGLEVLEKIKQDKPQVQIILLTGRGSIRDSEEGLEHGAADYIVKPIKIDKLIEKMRKVTGRE